MKMRMTALAFAFVLCVLTVGRADDAFEKAKGDARKLHEDIAGTIEQSKRLSEKIARDRIVSKVEAARLASVYEAKRSEVNRLAAELESKRGEMLKAYGDMRAAQSHLSKSVSEEPAEARPPHPIPLPNGAKKSEISLAPWERASG